MKKSIVEQVIITVINNNRINILLQEMGIKFTSDRH